MPHTPTDEQQDVIDSGMKFVQVQAGPGTGKTFTLLKKIKALTENGDLLPSERVLFCTFTNALTSSNLQSLAKDGNIDLSRVKASTLDGFIVEILCKLNISDDDKKALLNFDGLGYGTARETSNRLIQSKQPDIILLVEFMVKRYPYILIDEIQDIKDREEGVKSPKYQFLQFFRTSEALKQMIIVGDVKQSIFNPSYSAFTFDCEPLKLTVSQRKHEHSGDSDEAILQAVLNSPDTENKSSQEALTELSSHSYCQDTMIVVQIMSRFPNEQYSQLLTLPTFWYRLTRNGEPGHGQYTLPQVVISSIFWYRDSNQNIVKQSIESVLLPFKPALKRNWTFSYFKCYYYKLLGQEGQTFKGFLNSLLTEALNPQHPKVIQLKNFYTTHQHLYPLTITSFKDKLIVTTIESSKGLEAEDIYFFMNGTSRSPQHEFVAHTRNRGKLYLCQD